MQPLHDGVISKVYVSYMYSFSTNTPPRSCSILYHSLCMNASSSANELDGNVLPSQLTALHSDVLDRIAETLFHIQVGLRIAAFETEQAQQDVSFTRKKQHFP